MFDWNEVDSPPKTVEELWERVNRLIRSMPDFVFIDDRLISNGIAGTRIAHGRTTKPKAAIAYPSRNAGSAAMPGVTEWDDKTVLVKCSGVDVRASLIVVF